MGFMELMGFVGFRLMIAAARQFGPCPSKPCLPLADMGTFPSRCSLQAFFAGT